MKNCLVSLVSDQVTPNILVISHFRPEYLLFISTGAMEKKDKTQAIIETLRMRRLDYEGCWDKIIVAEDSILDLQAKVTQWIEKLPEDYRFIVNLTCGTKMMSLAAYDLFTDYESFMLYVPIPKNEYIVPFPKRRSVVPVELEDRLSVAEYLTAYGFRLQNAHELKNHKQYAEERRPITEFLYLHYREVHPLLKFLYGRLRVVKEKEFKRGYDFSAPFEKRDEIQEKVIKDLGFERHGAEIRKKITERDWQYLRGGWLEERLYLAVSRILPPPADVQLALVCRDREGAINEFDIIFTVDNALYFVEGKSLDSEEGDTEGIGGKISDFLYKIGALRQRFGLTPRAFLATTSKDIFDPQGEIKRHLVERSRQFNTKLIPLQRVSELEDWFRGEFGREKNRVGS